MVQGIRGGNFAFAAGDVIAQGFVCCRVQFRFFIVRQKHAGMVKGAACDGEVVVIAQETGQVSVWDVSRGTKLHDLATVKGKALGTITCLAVQEDGKYVAVGTESGLLWLWKS